MDSDSAFFTADNHLTVTLRNGEWLSLLRKISGWPMTPSDEESIDKFLETILAAPEVDNTLAS